MLVGADVYRSNTLKAHWRAKSRQLGMPRPAVNCRGRRVVWRAPRRIEHLDMYIQKAGVFNVELKIVLPYYKRRTAVMCNCAELDPSGVRRSPGARRGVERRAVVEPAVAAEIVHRRLVARSHQAPL